MAAPTKKTADTAEKTGALEVDRRQFLTTTAVVGGGLVLGFWLPPRPAAAAAVAGVAGEPWYRESLVPEINAWITIAPDDTVTVRISQVDLGTGVLTTNSMIVAEELQCDWSKVRSEYASANRNLREKAPEWMIIEPTGGDGAHDPAGPGHTVAVQRNTGVYRRMGVGSSSNVRENRYHLQLAGAEARERLLLAAATEWGVPAADLVAKDSVITHAATGRRTTYGVIAAQAAQIQLPDPSRIRVKTPDQWTLMGTEQKNREVPLKVTGQAKYAIDVRLPDMLYAAVKCCPVWGGDVRSSNFDAIRNMAGVHSMVRLPLDSTGVAKDVSPGRTTKDGFYSGGVAVIADTWWHAHQALEAMPIEWDYGPAGSVSSASQWEDHYARMNEPGDVIADEGDVDAGVRWGGQGHRGELHGAVHAPRPHGAGQRDGARDRRPGRHLGRRPEPADDAAARGHVDRYRARECARAFDVPGRRLWRQRQWPAGRTRRVHRQHGEGTAGQDGVDPRGGLGCRYHASPDGHRVVQSGAGCRRMADRHGGEALPQHRRRLAPQHPGARATAVLGAPLSLQSPYRAVPRGGGAGPRDRRECERLFHGVLHRRTGPRRGQGPVYVPARADHAEPP